MINATQDSFERDVIETSARLPVLVDFWAPWCAPCRTLGPLLERVEAQNVDRLRVVKVNTDENPELAAKFNVRSIPYVVAFANGKPVDSFVGVLSERQLHDFVERIVPDPSELERQKAARLRSAGDLAGAATALRAAIALDPSNDAARLDFATVLLEMRDPVTADEAAAVLAAASRDTRDTAAWRALHTAVDSLRRSATLPSAAQLQARIVADASDLSARLDLANLHVARREFAPAMEQLLAIVERDRSFGNDVGRTTLLSVFELAASDPQLVSTFRRRLASALNR